MVGFTKSAVTVLALVGATIAAPAPTTEVDYASILIPGPGLPSVKELGLTNADLNKPLPSGVELTPGLEERSADPKELFKRYEPFCGISGRGGCQEGDARACFNYLLKLDRTDCQVSGVIRMCVVGKCQWYGRSFGKGFASSWCRDVAHGGNWVLNNCNRNGRVSGSNAAGGNGNLVVDIFEE
ncbi:hypothetical protein Dda_9247 [Drechslerella dactyloides]|uniref:Uncharacterized protein n=1 Tax=Drechslerella dactyloides TaxID=74499 RepID=A0AAD6NEJ4_DREDA|nr:hypothetical protein Dda_9247 [Drechslerella dactyloides]